MRQYSWSLSVIVRNGVLLLGAVTLSLMLGSSAEAKFFNMDHLFGKSATFGQP